MHRLIAALIVIVAWTTPSTALASVAAQGRSVGTVVYEASGCDYFIVQSANGYALLEWYGGAIPMRGDVVVGAFEMYGMPEIYNRTQGMPITVWVDDYWMSRQRVIQRYLDHCQR